MSEQTKHKTTTAWEHDHSRLDNPYLMYKASHENGNPTLRWSFVKIICNSEHLSLNVKSLLSTTIKMNLNCLIHLNLLNDLILRMTERETCTNLSTVPEACPVISLKWRRHEGADTDHDNGFAGYANSEHHNSKYTNPCSLKNNPLHVTKSNCNYNYRYWRFCISTELSQYTLVGSM